MGRVNQCCYILDVSAKVDGSGPAGCSGRDTLGDVYNNLVADKAVVEKADRGGGLPRGGGGLPRGGGGEDAAGLAEVDSCLERQGLQLAPMVGDQVGWIQGKPHMPVSSAGKTCNRYMQL